MYLCQYLINIQLHLLKSRVLNTYTKHPIQSFHNKPINETFVAINVISSEPSMAR